MGHLSVECAGMPFIAFVLVFCSVFIYSPSQAYIYVNYNNTTTVLFDDLPALFGPQLPKDGLMGILMVSHPLNGCTAMDRPPIIYNPNITKFIALIQRDDCPFDIKVFHAQQAGFSAAVIHNLNSDILLYMRPSNETLAEQIEIPSMFISYHASTSLRKIISEEKETFAILKPDFTFPISYYLIPFTGVVGMIVLVMFVVLVIRCVQYRKRVRKNRLSKEQLKRIPTHKFTKGDDYDVCAICLDDYEEGDKLRVLPCSHAYHCKCVDPWLTRTKKTCPVCKQRVTRKNPELPESDSEEEASGRREEEETEGEGDSERTPLLRSTSSGTLSGSPADYSATNTTATITTAQCLVSPVRCDSPLLGYEGYYSPQEDSDSDSGDDQHHTDTAQLIGRDNIIV